VSEMATFLGVCCGELGEEIDLNICTATASNGCCSVCVGVAITDNGNAPGGGGRCRWVGSTGVGRRVQGDFVGFEFHPVEGAEGEVKLWSAVEDFAEIGGLQALQNPPGQGLVVGFGGGEADGEVFVGHDGVEGGHAVEKTALETGVLGLVEGQAELKAELVG
jgi:hypothetical protein